jgi:hypothetical protein
VVGTPLPDGSLQQHWFEQTEGWGVYDTGQITDTACHPNVQPIQAHCARAPWWDLGNVGHGHESEVDYYASDQKTMLKQVVTRYQAVCPPRGWAGRRGHRTGTLAAMTGNW